MQFVTAVSILSLVFMASPGETQDAVWIDPIEEISAEAKEAVFAAADHSKPLTLHSAEQANEYFAEDELAKLTKDVDFSQQCILVFAWRGSGQDKLDYSVMESFPEQVVFSHQPGRTRDLRPHVRIFALRANVNWSVRGGAESDDATRLAHYLSEDGELRFPVTLRDAQSGFAGETGFVWTIDCDGSWTRQSFLNEDVREADEQGQLSKEQIKELAQALVKADLVGLTASTGQAGVNPHIVTMTYGKKKAAVILQAGMLLPDPEDGELHDPVQRMSYLASIVRKMLQPED